MATARNQHLEVSWIAAGAALDIARTAERYGRQPLDHLKISRNHGKGVCWYGGHPCLPGTFSVQMSSRN